VGTLNALQGNVRTPTHPINAPNAEAAGVNFMRVFDIREIVLHPPAENQPMRPVYDRAVQLYGGRDAALAALDRAVIDMVDRLHDKIVSGDRTMSDPNGLERRLAAMDRGIGRGEGDYYNLEPAGVDAAELLRFVRGGDLNAAPRPEDRASGVQPLPIIETIPYDFGSYFPLNGFGDRQFAALQGGSTPTLNSLFGGEGNAQAAVTEMAEAYATVLNSPDDLSAQQAAARDLLEALNRIPRDKEIWNASVHPHFAAAIAALERGDLRTALSELTQETSLNAVYDDELRLHAVTVSQPAIARLRVGALVRLLERDNISENLQYRRGPSGRSAAWDVLYHDFGANYAWLLMSGSDQVYQIDRTTNQPVAVGSPRRVDGDGHAADLMYRVTWGGSMFRTPVEAALSLRLGWMWWGLQSEGPNGELMEVSANNPYGIASFDVTHVGYEGRIPPFRPSRAGIGIFNLNPYTYVTLTGTYIESTTGGLRLAGHYTPRYLLHWGWQEAVTGKEVFFQHRPGIDIRPLDFTIQSGQTATWNFGPGVSYDANVDRNIHSLEPYLYAGMRWTGGVEAQARVGYFMEFGDNESFHIPNTLTGSLNLVLTPGEWGNGGAFQVRILNDDSRTESLSAGGRAQGGVRGSTGVRASDQGGTEAEGQRR
jgi:hypothetical protein